MFIGPFVVSQRGIWRMKPLSALETLFALDEGRNLEHSLSPWQKGSPSWGIGFLGAFAARFLIRWSRPVFHDGCVVLDRVRLEDLVKLCARYEKRYWKGREGQ